MMTKTTPGASGAISLDAFNSGIENKLNDTQISANYKHKKQPFILADFLNPRTRKSKLHHVFLGIDADSRAYEAFEMMSYRTPSIIYVMPWGENQFDYEWDVFNKAIDILSAGRYLKHVQELGNALHQAGAKNVYGRADGHYLHWNQPVSNMEAA